MTNSASSVFHIVENVPTNSSYKSFGRALKSSHFAHGISTSDPTSACQNSPKLSSLLANISINSLMPCEALSKVSYNHCPASINRETNSIKTCPTRSRYPPSKVVANQSSNCLESCGKNAPRAKTSASKIPIVPSCTFSSTKRMALIEGSICCKAVSNVPTALAAPVITLLRISVILTSTDLATFTNKS